MSNITTIHTGQISTNISRDHQARKSCNIPQGYHSELKGGKNKGHDIKHIYTCGDTCGFNRARLAAWKAETNKTYFET